MAKQVTLNESVAQATGQPTPTNTLPIKVERKRTGDSTVVAVDLKEFPEVLAQIRAEAKADDREPSKYLRRVIVKHYTQNNRIAGE